MNPIVHAKQKVIGRQVVQIADDIAKRLGLETRLHKLCIENLEEPMCEIGVYTPHGHTIGAIDVLLNVADCKAKVTCALFRDLEDAVDNWTFTCTHKIGESRREPCLMRCTNRNCATDVWEGSGFKVELCPNCQYPGSVVQDETASAESPNPVALECRNESCSETTFWVATRITDATMCPSCESEATIVQRFACSNSECITGSWDPRRYPEFRRTCPGCGTEGVAATGSKEGDASRLRKCWMHCTNSECQGDNWECVVGHGTELCPACLKPGTPVDPEKGGA